MATYLGQKYGMKWFETKNSPKVTTRMVKTHPIIIITDNFGLYSSSPMIFEWKVKNGKLSLYYQLGKSKTDSQHMFPPDSELLNNYKKDKKSIQVASLFLNDNGFKELTGFINDYIGDNWKLANKNTYTRVRITFVAPNKQPVVHQYWYNTSKK